MGTSHQTQMMAAMVESLCSSGRSHEAHHRLSLLLSSSSSSSSYYFDDRTCNALLARLLHAGRTPLLTLRLLRRTLPHFTPSLSTYNRLLHLLCSHHSPPLPLHAHHLLLRMRTAPDAASYTSLLDGYARLADSRSALQLFDEMPRVGIAPNSLTRTVLIKAFLRSRNIEQAMELITQLWPSMERSRQEEEEQSLQHAAFANLIHCLCRQGFFHIVFQIAEEMPQRESVTDEFAYSQMIDSLCRAEQHHGASRIVYMMRKRGLLPSLVSYNCIVHGLSCSGRRAGGCMRAYQLAMEGATQFGYCPPEPTYKALLQALCRENDLAKAKDILELVLQQCGEKDADCRTRMYNIFLSALRIVDNPSEQLNVLMSMLQRQCRPDVITLNTVIHGFCKVGRVKEARKIVEDMLNGTFCPPDVVTFTTLICGYLDVGEHAEALHVLHTLMPRCRCSPNVVTYNGVLKGLFSLRQVDRAMEIFAEMKGKGIAADCATHTAVIKGLCEAGQLEKAKMFWDDIVWPSNIHDDYVYAAIFQGLCKLGKLDRACDFLYELVDSGIASSLICYNILIDAACKLGLKQQAYQIVKEMKRNGLTPDAVTWRILDKLHQCSREEEHPTLDGNADVADDKVVLRDLEHLISTEHEIPSSKIACEDTDDNAKIEEELGDSLEDLVDPPTDCTELAEEEEDYEMDATVIANGDITNKEDVHKKQPPQPLEREPLSRVARRVFGLLESNFCEYC